MDLVLLSRIQFGLTICFHYLYPPLSIGLSLIIMIIGAFFLKTHNPLYQQMMKFWVRIFGLTFALGVATGVVMEFEFGTNWASYSRYVGDVFGSALAAEGIFAFFLESGFLAILMFGWNKVSSRLHWISALMVALGAHFSAIWIVVANSWMQTPAGYHIVNASLRPRAEITNFWELVFNPSSAVRLTHTVLGAWQAAAFLVLSVSAFYLLKRQHEDFARASMKIGLVMATIASLGSLASGHLSARVVSKYQPAKLAAMEAHFPVSSPADLYLFGWVKEAEQRVMGGIKIPGMLSRMVHGDPQVPVTGLNAFPKQDWPPVNSVFQMYHIMIVMGLGLIGLSLMGVLWWWRGKLYQSQGLLWVFVVSVLGPQIGNQVGWATAEMGRQPWIVYGLMRTSEGVSKSVSSEQILGSLILFALIYILLFALFIYLLDRKIRRGPLADDLEMGFHSK